MKKSLDERIAENLKYEIKLSGKSKKEIARAVGVSEKCISGYVTGRRQPQLATLSRLCSFLDCSADEILCVEETFKL